MSRATTGIHGDLSAESQLVALCPLVLAVSSMSTGLAAGIVVLILLPTAMIAVSLLMRFIPGAFALPVLLMINATIITIAWWHLQGHYFALATMLGISIPVNVLNSAWLNKLDAIALRKGVVETSIDAIRAGLYALLLLWLIGTLRELLAGGGVDWQAWNVVTEAGTATGSAPNWQGPDLLGAPAGAFLLFAGALAFGRKIQVYIERDPVEQE
ncbi:MAG: hypothetical protein EPO31_02215 [Gammaproteobacteria bacterium]|nr:MAG: hypothetical protein EPO31_02215 [Gammaproteobacteria bacterium]